MTKLNNELVISVTLSLLSCSWRQREWLETARVALRIGAVRLFVCPSVTLSPNCVHKNAVSFFQKLNSFEL